MLEELRKSREIQLLAGLVTGIFFGFFIQRGGVTHFDVIIGQLLLKDFTVLKVMLTAVLTGTLGVHFLVSKGYASLHVKPGSLGQTAVGGLIFGVGFAMLGYCPGTHAGAIGQGSLDALFAGLPGILLGAWLFSLAYPLVKGKAYPRGHFGTLTFPELLKKGTWPVVLSFAAGIAAFLVLLEMAGL